MINRQSSAQSQLIGIMSCVEKTLIPANFSSLIRLILAVYRMESSSLQILVLQERLVFQSDVTPLR